ncbi:hydrogenase accessory protein HypB, partial [Streptomyces goshikiensis]
LGESLRVVLASVTEGEDKPLKYPTAFGLAHLVVVTKTDIAAAVEFDEAAFRAHVQQVNPGVEVVLTSARSGAGVGELLERALAVGDGAAVHQPVMAGRQHGHRQHHHDHDHGDGGHGHHDHDHRDGHHGHDQGDGGHDHRDGHDHGTGHGNTHPAAAQTH